MSTKWSVVPLVHPFSQRGEYYFEQPFGLSEDDWFPSSSAVLRNYYNAAVRPAVASKPVLNRQSSSLLLQQRGDPSKFQVMLDVNQFTPEEITVKTTDNSLVVHAKHEEKVDEHGYISREFQRRYIIPDNVDPEAVVSSLSHDGILTVEAPYKALEAPKGSERVVTIIRREIAAAPPAQEQQPQQQPQPQQEKEVPVVAAPAQVPVTVAPAPVEAQVAPAPAPAAAAAPAASPAAQATAPAAPAVAAAAAPAASPAAQTATSAAAPKAPATGAKTPV